VGEYLILIVVSNRELCKLRRRHKKIKNRREFLTRRRKVTRDFYHKALCLISNRKEIWDDFDIKDGKIIEKETGEIVELGHIVYKDSLKRIHNYEYRDIIDKLESFINRLNRVLLFDDYFQRMNKRTSEGIVIEYPTQCDTLYLSRDNQSISINIISDDSDKILLKYCEDIERIQRECLKEIKNFERDLGQIENIIKNSLGEEVLNFKVRSQKL
jgi:hypothetical protein